MLTRMVINGDAPPTHRSRVGALAIGAWTVVVLSLLALLWEFYAWVNTREDSCNLQPDLGGMDGEPGSSWWPPGPTCTYQVQSPRSDGTLTLTVESSMFVWTTTLLLVTCVVLLVALRRARRGN
jgi:hypothetical protein